MAHILSEFSAILTLIDVIVDLVNKCSWIWQFTAGQGKHKAATHPPPDCNNKRLFVCTRDTMSLMSGTARPDCVQTHAAVVVSAVLVPLGLTISYWPKTCKNIIDIYMNVKYIYIYMYIYMYIVKYVKCDKFRIHLHTPRSIVRIVYHSCCIIWKCSMSIIILHISWYIGQKVLCYSLISPGSIGSSLC